MSAFRPLDRVRGDVTELRGQALAALADANAATAAVIAERPHQPLGYDDGVLAEDARNQALADQLQALSSVRARRSMDTRRPRKIMSRCLFDHGLERP